MEDIFDRGISGAITDYTQLHGISRETIQDTAQYKVHRWFIQGDFESIRALRDKHYCNELVSSDDTIIHNPDAGLGDMDVVIIGMEIDKAEGNRAILTITTKAFSRGYEGGIDFEVVAKDIHYWRQLCKTGVPSLKSILLWEQMKDNPETIDKYYVFKYVDAQGEEQEIQEGTPTRALAEMIARGVESYNEYVPTLVITYNLAKYPTKLPLGKKFEAGALLGNVISNVNEIYIGGDSSFQIPIGESVNEYTAEDSPVEIFWNLFGEGKVICTADQVRMNSDGSCTVTRGFSKFRQIEPELYVGGGGSYGPYDKQSDVGA